MKHRATCAIALLVVLCLPSLLHASAKPPRQMKIGVDADNWSGQINNLEFEKSLRLMQLDFISWHIMPEEETSPERLDAIVNFCRKNHWHYLFNTEIANYRRDDKRFQHSDGTFRYDVAEQTLEKLKGDPLFLGVVYDEADLMQSLLGVSDEKGKPIEPYLVETRKLSPDRAFLAVAETVSQLQQRYARYGKRLIFEMTFPDYPHAFARGGAVLAPKLLKENFNDLMYDVYRGAALEYSSTELWACVDLWFLDKFPTAGKYSESFHTPDQLTETLQFAYLAGFDYVYVEQIKALVDPQFHLTEYGRRLIAFQAWRAEHPYGDWRTARIDYYVKRFPDGYWGQRYSRFIPDHPYGTWSATPYRHPNDSWLKTLHELSHGVIPDDADTWNATLSPYFSKVPYRSTAGLPQLVVFDHFGRIPASTRAKVIDLSGGK